MWNAYKYYPYPVPWRTRIINLFRYAFTLPVLERILLKGLRGPRSTFWRKCIPPIFFYDRDDIRTTERNGVRYTLMLCDLIDYQVFFNIRHDPATIHLLELIKADYHVLDIGANVGSYSLRFAKLAEKGKVYAIEPSRFNYERLRKNIELNSFRNILTFNIALGDSPSVANLSVVNPYNLGMNRIRATAGPYSSEQVEITTLDKLYEQNTFDRVDLVKIDTEGFELKVLRGASQLLQRCTPVLFVELIDDNLRQQGDDAKSLLEFIEMIGYSVLDARTMKEVDRSVQYTDILCFPKKR